MTFQKLLHLKNAFNFHIDFNQDGIGPFQLQGDFNYKFSFLCINNLLGKKIK